MPCSNPSIFARSGLGHGKATRRITVVGDAGSRQGKLVYVNLWSRRAAQAYDLAAGIMLVRGAGGDVTDLAGTPIETTDHRGPFVAGIDEEARCKVAALVLVRNSVD